MDSPGALSGNIKVIRVQAVGPIYQKKHCENDMPQALRERHALDGTFIGLFHRVKGF
jgi:hypothetical protein